MSSRWHSRIYQAKTKAETASKESVGRGKCILKGGRGICGVHYNVEKPFHKSMLEKQARGAENQGKRKKRFGILLV